MFDRDLCMYRIPRWNPGLTVAIAQLLGRPTCIYSGFGAIMLVSALQHETGV